MKYQKSFIGYTLIIDIKYKIKNKTKGSIFPRFVSYDGEKYLSVVNSDNDRISMTRFRTVCDGIEMLAPVHFVGDGNPQVLG